ncbi:MAG: hypothetical protein ACLR6B_06635 [Blautia sp.]
MISVFPGPLPGFHRLSGCKGERSGVGESRSLPGHISHTIVGQISTLINIYPDLCKGMESVRSIGDILEEKQVEPNHSIVPLGDLRETSVSATWISNIRTASGIS